MLNKLINLPKFYFNYDIGKKTWFGSGGKCIFYCTADTLSQLLAVIKIYSRIFPLFIIGNGSNLIIRDGGFNGVIVKLGDEFKKIELDEKQSIISLGAGINDLEVAKFCLKNSITGFEFLRGIPGTIGGNLKMNAGCYGSQISDTFIDCVVLEKNQNIKTLTKSDICFGYRSSSLKDDQIILNARFRVKSEDKTKIENKILKISTQRKNEQPIASRTGGSTFSNPDSHSAWRLINASKLKRKRVGGAKISELHSNFIINDKDATSLDIEILGEEIRQAVFNKFKIRLKWEIQRIGKFKKI